MSIPVTLARRAGALLASAAMLSVMAACGQGGGANSSNVSGSVESNGVIANGPKMTNEPGLVTPTPAGSPNLSGHFEIRPAQPGDAFVFSSGLGGACLVTQYPAQPKSCTQHSQCGLPSSGIGDGASAYCIPESPGRPTVTSDGIPPNGAGTCWIKPSEDFCLKRVGEGPHDTPAADTTAVASENHVKKWRVLTCLSGAAFACRGAPATPHEIQHQAGDVYTAP